jgi:hypothetical protein
LPEASFPKSGNPTQYPSHVALPQIIVGHYLNSWSGLSHDSSLELLFHLRQVGTADVQRDVQNRDMQSKQMKMYAQKRWPSFVIVRALREIAAGRKGWSPLKDWQKLCQIFLFLFRTL